MEVDEAQKQVCKFQRVSSNGSATTTDNNSSNPYKLATSRGNLDVLNHVNDGGGVARFSGWPSSRIVRVSRATGGKDRHSKVLTSKGLRDRRVRLSVGTAIQFYDLQDRLGFDQPSKAVEWLLNAAASSIDELPDLDVPIPGVNMSDCHREHQMQNENELMVIKRNNLDSNNIVAGAKLKLKSKSKSPSSSSTSETSKGESELSLSRSENRAKARERARLLALKKEKEKKNEIGSSRVTILDQVNNISDTSSFTDLLTGRCQMEYLFNRPVQASPQLLQMPHFNISAGDNLHHFSFHDGLLPPVTPIGGTGAAERHHLNFSTPLSSGGGVVSPGGFTRGTLQSNSVLPHYHHLQRFQSSFVDGSMSANLPLFILPNAAVDSFPTTGGYNFSCGGGGDGGGRHSDHHKEKLKN